MADSSDVRMSSKEARRALLLNILVLPGWGTLKAGRRGSGLGQLVIGLIGFVLTVGVLLKVGAEWFNSLQEERPLLLDQNLVWWAGTGLVLFFVSWFWALASSIELLRHASRNTPPQIK